LKRIRRRLQGLGAESDACPVPTAEVSTTSPEPGAQTGSAAPEVVVQPVKVTEEGIGRTVGKAAELVESGSAPLKDAVQRPRTEAELVEALSRLASDVTSLQRAAGLFDEI